MRSKFLILMLILTACTTGPSKPSLQKLEFSVSDASIEGFKISGMKLIANFEVYNPNDVDVILDNFNYEVYIGGEKAMSGSVRKQYHIKPRETIRIPVSSTISFLDLPGLYKVVKSSFGKEEIEFTAYLNSEVNSAFGRERQFSTAKKVVPVIWR